jgi:tetratricopeptide (TPR) repeat protein
MKTQKIFLFSIIMISGLNVYGNDEKYMEMMLKNIQAVYQTREIPELQKIVNSFERIASVEKDKWEPLYYIAYGNIMMANFEKDGSKKDGYLDLAEANLAKAKALASKESEVFALEGFIAMIRISVDPQARGMLYSQKATQSYAKALELNPKNPRALSLMAQMQFGTAQFFNNPVTEACATNEQALTLFEHEPEGPTISPAWGKKMAESLQARCK